MFDEHCRLATLAATLTLAAGAAPQPGELTVKAGERLVVVAPQHAGEGLQAFILCSISRTPSGVSYDTRGFARLDRSLGALLARADANGDPVDAATIVGHVGFSSPPTF
jgi:hypothetical protein